MEGPGEFAQWLRPLIDITEDLGLSLRTHMMAHSHLMLSSDLCGHQTQTWYILIHSETSHKHKINKPKDTKPQLKVTDGEYNQDTLYTCMKCLKNKFKILFLKITIVLHVIWKSHYWNVFKGNEVGMSS